MTSDNIKAMLLGEGQDEFKVKGRNVGNSFVKRAKAKINNRNPKGDNANFLPGIAIKDGQAVTIIPSLTITPLYITVQRLVMGKEQGKFVNKCSSADGVVPDARHEKPFCQGLTADAVYSQLKERQERFGKLDDARLRKDTSVLTHNTPLLQQCALATPSGGLINMCPRSKWKEVDGEWIKPSCKESVLLIAYDHTTGKELELELTGKSIQNDKKHKSSFAEMRAWLGHNGYPYYLTSVELDVAEDQGFYHARFSNFALLTDDELAVAMKEAAFAAKEGVRKRREWKPSATPTAPLGEKPKKGLASLVKDDDDDDIPFG